MGKYILKQSGEMGSYQYHRVPEKARARMEGIRALSSSAVSFCTISISSMILHTFRNWSLCFHTRKFNLIGKKCHIPPDLVVTS